MMQILVKSKYLYNKFYLIFLTLSFKTIVFVKEALNIYYYYLQLLGICAFLINRKVFNVQKTFCFNSKGKLDC